MDTFPNVTEQLFVELNGEIDFLVVVGMTNEKLLTEEQIKAIYDRALELPHNYDRQRVGVVIRQKRALIYRDGKNYLEDGDGHPQMD